MHYHTICYEIPVLDAYIDHFNSFMCSHYLIDLDRQGFVDATYTIFALICIQLWIKIFVERTGFRNVGG